MAFLFPGVGSVIANKAQKAHTCRWFATNGLALHCIWNLIFWIFFAFCFIKNVSEQGIQSYTSDTHSQSTKQNFETAKLFNQMGRCFACKDSWYNKISYTETAKLQLGVPSVVIHATLYPRWYTGGRDVQAIFGTTGQTGYLLFLLFRE